MNNIKNFFLNHLKIIYWWVFPSTLKTYMVHLLHTKTFSYVTCIQLSKIGNYCWCTAIKRAQWSLSHCPSNAQIAKDPGHCHKVHWTIRLFNLQSQAVLQSNLELPILDIFEDLGQLFCKIKIVLLIFLHDSEVFLSFCFY